MDHPSNNNNSYGSLTGNNKNDNNPIGPPGNNNNDSFCGQGNNNPYSPQNDQKYINFGGDFNVYMNKQIKQNNDSNPFVNNTKDNSKIDT